MKKLLYILSIFILVGFTSCSDWLDINENPNTPVNTDASVDARLRGMQHYYLYGQGTAGTRAAMITGTLTRTVAAGNAHNELCAWNPIINSSTTPYQMFFIGCGANIQDLIDKAEKEEAWHYIGAAKMLRAMGFMLMLDWYGEMPYREALGAFNTPKYDNGKTIFEGCLTEVDEAIGYFQKSQPSSATPFSNGDVWNGGDTQKWIKLAYGLKARWLNNLSKKSAYDPTAILDALAKAAQSNAESLVVKHYNTDADIDRDVLLGDPLHTSILYDNIGMNTTFFLTKWYADLLTNTFTGGSGVEDPRADKIIPAAQYKNATTGKIEMKRSKVVDMINSDIRVKGGPILALYTAEKGWTIASDDPARKGDSLYVNLRSQGAMYFASAKNDDTYIDETDGRIKSTGSFYTRPDAPTHLLSYPELCFIKAEVLYRKGDAGALAAYKEGIESHMRLMNEKLKEYPAGNNPSKKIITEAEIDAFMKSAAVAQSIGELTMAKIMQQKYIACSFSQQNWNDMRRFNYSAGNVGGFGVVYTDFERPYEFTATTKMTGASKTDPRYWFRRMMQCSHEQNYNRTNLTAINPEALESRVWSLPVWWDIEE